MGQQCSCLQHAPKYARRQSDTSDTLEPNVHVDVDSDTDVDGQELHVLLHGRVGGSRSTGEANGSRVLKRTNSGSAASARTGGLVDQVVVDSVFVEDEEEKAEENEHSASAVERQMLRKLDTRLVGSVDDSGPHPPSLSSRQAGLSRVLQSYREATGLVDEGQLELECIMCLDTFSQDNPKVRTLCDCGMNRTNFHLSCLLEWLNRDANCPVCRAYLYYEEP